MILITPILIQFVVCEEDLSGSTLEVSPLEIYSQENSTITVEVKGSGGLVEGANVDLSAEGGQFNGGPEIYNGTSNTAGLVVVNWTAPVVLEVTNYTIRAIISFVNSTTVIREETILVHPLDFSQTTFEAEKATVNENEAVLLIVTTKGTGGVIPEATVSIIAPDGSFNSTASTTTSGVTDNSGKFQDFWIAPNVDAEQNRTLTATISHDGMPPDPLELDLELVVSPVEGQLILDIELSEGEQLIIGETQIIDITVIDQLTAETIEGAEVYFNAVDGIFTESGSDIYHGTTDSTGTMTVHWETTTLEPSYLGTNYPIDITAAKIGLKTNYTTLTFLVRPEVGELDVAIESEHNSISLGESVTITITIQIGGIPYQDALVSIVALDGVFESSGTTEVSGYTTADGEFSFTWETADMVMEGSNPVNYTFSITIDIFPYYLEQEYDYSIIVEPTTIGDGIGSSGAFYTQWWFYLIVGLIIIGGGSIIILITRNK
ncbi:hypothetical protein EU523_00615 [Candidatus Heimdallarchaeota archaeon]|nr:MAG: hypothetical protein EU523_00615 [Candidatus Heimdallarchaeota archaeon]